MAAVVARGNNRIFPDGALTAPIVSLFAQEPLDLGSELLTGDLSLLIDQRL